MDDATRHTTRLLIAAAIGLGILLVWGLAWGAEPFDARAALARSQAALGKRVGDYTLTDTKGEVVRLASFRGKPLVVSFVYTGCFDVCPTTTRFLAGAIAEAQRAVGPGTFNVITVGFNLPFDSPGAMRDFQRRHGLDVAGWRFLAADATALDGLARDVGFSWQAGARGFDHVTQATLVDADGRVVRQIYGDTFELPMLVAPLRDLLTGNAVPIVDVAGLVERVRILCTVYDPRLGRYRLDYALFVEIFAGLTILGATAAWLVREWRSQRPPRRATP